MDHEKAEETGRKLLRAREIFAYGGLDGVLNRPLLNDLGTYPHFAAKANGYQLTDGSGQQYIDWINGWSSVILGHNHEVVREAIIKQATLGTFVTLMHPVEVDAAELIVEMVPNAEMVAFGKNGSDSLTAAIRIARAHTGKDMILQHGFHGFHDWYVCTNKNVRGVLPAWRDYVEPFPYNDLAALQELFSQHAGNVAAIVMEPVNFLMPDDGYLKSVKELAHKNGALLIWDEVVTAFRLHRGGAQGRYGIMPDLAVLGKAMGNGMPLSAVVGPRPLMEVLKTTGYGMTFRGESISLAAANACLRFMNQNDVVGHLFKVGEQVRSEFNALASSLDVAAELIGLPSRMAFRFAAQNGRHPKELKSIFILECLKHGILTNGNILPTFAHDRAAIDQSMEVFSKAILKVRDAFESSSNVTSKTALPHDASSLKVKGVLGGVKYLSQRTVFFGWLFVDGQAADRLEFELEDGSKITAQRVSRADLDENFPNILNARSAGFRCEIENTGESKRHRRVVLVATVGGVERFHCLIVDDSQPDESSSDQPKDLTGPFSLRDGIVILK